MTQMEGSQMTLIKACRDDTDGFLKEGFPVLFAAFFFFPHEFNSISMGR
jgi:hypothetical protein